MTHKKTWECTNPCGDGCDGNHPMTLNLEETERLARAATKGEWYVAKVFSGKIQADLLFIRSRENTLNHNTDHAIAEVFGGTGPRPIDAAFIVHMHPERTLAMVERIRSLEKERDEMKEKLALALSDASIKHKYRADALEKERDEAQSMQRAIEEGSAEWEHDALKTIEKVKGNAK